MKISLRLALAGAAALALAACQQETAPESAETATEPVVLKTIMTDVITPGTEEVLNILIDALDEQTEVDPSKLTDDDWAAIEAAAARLRGAAIAMRDGDVRVVATPGEPIENEEFEGTLNAADVQTRIDADPDGFKTHASALLAEFDTLATAIQARDGDAMWDAALNLDPACLECHEVFWYPEVEDEDHDDEDDH